MSKRGRVEDVSELPAAAKRVKSCVTPRVFARIGSNITLYILRLVADQTKDEHGWTQLARTCKYIFGICVDHIIPVLYPLAPRPLTIPSCDILSIFFAKESHCYRWNTAYYRTYQSTTAKTCMRPHLDLNFGGHTYRFILLGISYVTQNRKYYLYKHTITTGYIPDRFTVWISAVHMGNVTVTSNWKDTNNRFKGQSTHKLTVCSPGPDMWFELNL